MLSSSLARMGPRMVFNASITLASISPASLFSFGNGLLRPLSGVNATHGGRTPGVGHNTEEKPELLSKRFEPDDDRSVDP